MENYIGNTDTTAAKRFWPKVLKTDSCWLWQASHDKDGYGFFKFRKKQQKAHRVSYIIHNGEIPDGIQVCHECDNPPCVNPNHLFLGTHQDNVDDKVNKSRQPKHENHGRTILSLNNVIEIRNLYECKIKRPFELAKIFNVSHACIMDIVKHRSWKDI